MLNPNKSKKIFLLYSLIALGFIIFLSVMLLTAVKPRNLPSLYTKESSKAERGNIISADGFHIATTKKLYKAVVNNYYIDPNKKDLFVELFSIYSSIDPKLIRKKLDEKKGVIVLSYDIQEKQAQYLKQLAYELRRYKVFIERVNSKTGHRSLHGLSIIESGESREYPYGNLLTPIIGYTQKLEDNGYTRIKGIKGLEKRFEGELSSLQDGLAQGPRDVNHYIILNKKSFTKSKLNGLNIKLTIPVDLQKRIEKMCDSMKEELQAKEIMLAVMNSYNGEILTLASSNRFFPKDIKKSDYPSLNSSMIEYSFEPGSVIKPITYALLLDKNLINPYDLVNGHNGKYKIGNKTITDEHSFDWLSADNTIVYSSNIGIAQLAQKLSGKEFHNGLKRFGFTKKSTDGLVYEKSGTIPSAKRLDNEIYKATSSYGYGMHVNLMQLLKSYSAFSNNGRVVSPKLINSFTDEYNRDTLNQTNKQKQVIKSSTAAKIKKVLIKTVNKGTGKKTKTDGLIIGGKTGTAHIVEHGHYIDKYNTSFIGFVDDNEHSYTIGAVVIEPQTSQFASKTAVPVFKNIIDIMIEENYLKPNIIK